MEHDFWHERWETDRIAFHQGATNAMLERHHGVLGAPGAGQALVPLCGKALDMAWLAMRGWSVLGVELSPIAVRGFFSERGLEPAGSRDGAFDVLEAEGVRLMCGDVFALERTQAAGVAAVYDRASLVALPTAMRGRYADHLIDVLPAGVPILLVTFEYPQAEADGPPFSVDEAEVRDLFGARRSVRRLETCDVLDDMPDLKARGLSRLSEHAFLLSG